MPEEAGKPAAAFLLTVKRNPSATTVEASPPPRQHRLQLDFLGRITANHFLS